VRPQPGEWCSYWEGTKNSRRAAKGAVPKPFQSGQLMGWITLSPLKGSCYRVNVIGQSFVESGVGGNFLERCERGEEWELKKT